MNDYYEEYGGELDSAVYNSIEKMQAESLLIYKEKFTAKIYAGNIERIYAQMGDKSYGKKN